MHVGVCVCEGGCSHHDCAGDLVERERYRLERSVGDLGAHAPTRALPSLLGSHIARVGACRLSAHAFLLARRSSRSWHMPACAVLGLPPSSFCLLFCFAHSYRRARRPRRTSSTSRCACRRGVARTTIAVVVCAACPVRRIDVRFAHPFGASVRVDVAVLQFRGQGHTHTQSGRSLWRAGGGWRLGPARTWHAYSEAGRLLGYPGRSMSAPAQGNRAFGAGRAATGMVGFRGTVAKWSRAAAGKTETLRADSRDTLGPDRGHLLAGSRKKETSRTDCRDLAQDVCGGGRDARADGSDWGQDRRE